MISRLCFILFILSSCVYNDLSPEDCGENHLSLELQSKEDNITCDDNIGRIEVQTAGGLHPIHYKINNGQFQASGIFEGLSSGVHLVEAEDKRGCLASMRVEIVSYESDLYIEAEAMPDTECFSDNGMAIINVRGGIPPYHINFQNNIYTSPLKLESLSSGTYVVNVTDSINCDFTLTFQIEGTTGVSWQNEIKPIIETRCTKPGCHIDGTGRVDFTKFENVKTYAIAIKTRTGNGSMPYDGPPLPDEQVKLIACWVDDGANE